MEEQNQEQPKEQDLIEKANLAAERLEKAQAKYEEMMAKRRLGGQTDAGQAPEKKPEIDPRDYAKMVLEGKLPQ